MDKISITLDNVQLEVDVLKYVQTNKSNKKYLIYKTYDKYNNRYIIQSGEFIEKNDEIELLPITNKEDFNILNNIIGEFYERL